VPDVTVKRFDEMDTGHEGMFVRARAELGVRSFGMQVIDLEAHSDRYPEHAHVGMPIREANDGQEEVYVPLRGSATLIAGGERWALEPGMAVRVGAAQLRRIVTAEEPFQMLAVSGTPGSAYEPMPFSEVGAGEEPTWR
jgi:mannose-6-phosphate isomerase-like protein (cupin superfamily)